MALRRLSRLRRPGSAYDRGKIDQGWTTMRTALLTDIHGNIEALAACLDHAAALGVERYVVLGDLVGYGPDPGAVVDRVQQLAEAGAIVLKGNHDEAIARGGERMNEVAAEAIRWTRDRLTAGQKTFLAGLPLTVREGDVLYVHASAARPAQWAYVNGIDAATTSLDATDARLTFCGHTHVPALFHRLPGRRVESYVPQPGKPVPFSRARRYLGVIGAVGQPRDRNPRACWGLLEDAGLTLHRVA